MTDSSGRSRRGSYADAHTTVEELRALVRTFVRERRFGRYHRPKNLAMSAAIEAAELMELFQWHDVPSARLRSARRLRARASEEIADTLAYLLSLCDAAGIDLTTAFKRKMRLNERRYPVRGRVLPRRR